MPLWRDRSFVLFWLARAVSIAGTAITTVVLPILVFRLTGSALLTSSLAALEAIPYLLFGLFAGAIADRVDRRRLMVVSDLLNLVLLASIPVAARLDLLTIAQIYVVGLLSATAFVWFDTANFGALPTLAGPKRLVSATSAIWSMSTLVAIVMPGLAGLLAATLGPAEAITLDVLSYGCSAVLLLLVPHAFNGTRGPTDSDQRGGIAATRCILGEIGEGVHFLWHQRLVRTMVLIGFGVSTMGGAVTGLLVVYSVQALDLTATDERLGLLFTAGAVGALGTTLLLPVLNKRISPSPITLVGLFLTLIFLVATALAPNFLTGLVALGLWNATYSLVVINGIALRQLVTPEPLQSRVNATGRMITWGGTPFGAAVGGVIAQATNVRVAYLAMAAIVAICCIFGWFSPLRRQDATKEQTIR